MENNERVVKEFRNEDETSIIITRKLGG